MYPMAVLAQMSKSIHIIMKALFLPDQNWKQFKYTQEEIN